MESQKSSTTDGSSWDLKSTGLKRAELFKSKQVFYIINTSLKEGKHSQRIFGLYTNDLKLAFKWYFNKNQVWNKQGVSSLYIREGNFA